MTSSNMVAGLETLLEAQGLTVVEMPHETGTAQQAAAAIGATTKQIVKSLVLVAGGDPVLVLAAGDRQVDLDLVAAAVGRTDARMARAAEVKEITGFSIGGVPPLGHRNPLPTFIDRRLMEEPTVYAAAGTQYRVFAVTPEQLRQLSSAHIISISA